jgi:hypothetical protein
VLVYSNYYINKSKCYAGYFKIDQRSIKTKTTKNNFSNGRFYLAMSRCENDHPEYKSPLEPMGGVRAAGILDMTKIHGTSDRGRSRILNTDNKQHLIYYAPPSYQTV